MSLDQLALWADQPSTGQPACPRCGEPQWWMRLARRWSGYCGERGCDNPQRVCKGCGQTFLRQDGFVRYCSIECRQRLHGIPVRSSVACAVCGQPHRGRNQWDLCPEHLAVIRPVLVRLTRHHVSREFVIALIRNPTCELCGRDLLTPVPSPGGHFTSPLVVDHDHRHCPGDYSCGLCVRGLLCRPHNSMIGMAHDDARLLREAADYLDRWCAATP